MASEEIPYDYNEALKLENQLCFPLYACSKEVVRRYTPFLDELDLTYTQYITMLVLWEEEELSVKDLGQRLFLDSGTLTPLLKKMEAKGLVVRERSKEDERRLVVSLTEQGAQLKEKAADIPLKMGQCVGIDPEDAKQLAILLHKVMDNIVSSESVS
jgi:DNA-binding MarR family transcriptional regulator